MTNFENLKYTLSINDEYNVLSLLIDDVVVGYIEFEYMDDNYDFFQNNYSETEYKSLFPDNKLVYVENVYIEKEYRNYGFATSMMKKLFEVNGYKHILLNAKSDKESDIAQDKLVNWYNKLGFIVVKKSDRYTEMWKELTL